MTKNKEKIPVPLRRSITSFIAETTAVIMLWAIAATAHGQRLGISGSEEPVAGRWDRLVNQPSFQIGRASCRERV